MAIIREKSFTKNWIVQKSKELKYDPTLVEKVIHAFELLSFLIDKSVNLIFKGGTSLLLLLPEHFKRVSIDLDVIITNKNLDLPVLFDQIVNESLFINWEENIREKTKGAPLKHFKFYYNSSINKRQEPVLLDVLFLKEVPYSEIIKKTIALEFFETNKKIEVEIPTVEGLFADKLTAFAPNTIGIRYGEGKSTERIKQLFDLGLLFYYIKDTGKVEAVYENIAKIEAEFRNIKKHHSFFLEDSFKTAFLVCQLNFQHSISNKKTDELKDGIRRIRSFISQGKYNLLNSKEDASKVALISYILKEGLKISMEEVLDAFENINTEDVKDISLGRKFEILNKLKRVSPQSFYLWAIIDGKVR